jgi:maltooligosyltrehalose trehalohydrolase
MHRFAVWAPDAKTVVVKVNGKDFPMNGPVDHGWWLIEIEDAVPGDDYCYLLDEDKSCYPDPRSQWQPNGVHGFSRIYDQNTFLWTDATFQAPPLAGGVIYELHVGTFTDSGTLESAIEKLDHFIELGITHIELMPVGSFAGRHGWGYDGVALFSVHQPYGGPDALKRFVNAAHEKGIAVLLDVVYNHFGPSGNYTGKFGPYLTKGHPTPWGGAVNLEEAWSGEVRRFFCDNALMWMRDFHVDGLRLDAVHAFIDRSAIHFLEQLAAEVETLSATVGRHLVLIAESDLNDPRVVSPREVGGFGMNAQWNDDFHHALFAALNRTPAGGYYSDFGSLSQLSKALEEVFVYDGSYSMHRNRMHGRPVGNLSRHRFIGFIQNHDQVGNRAIGDRICDVVGFDCSKIAAAFVLLSPFVPMLFQGEEWAASSPFQYFADHDDPNLARLVSDGRKREFAAFGWSSDSIPDPESRATFERSKLKWSELTNPSKVEMLGWYRDLIQLRRSIMCLNDGEPGNTRVRYSEEQKWLCMERGDIHVICNLSDSERMLPVPKGSHLILASRPDLTLLDEELRLTSDSVAVIKTSSGT